MEVTRRAKGEDIDFSIPLILDSNPEIFGKMSFREKVRNIRRLVNAKSPLSMDFFLIYEFNGERVGICSIYNRKDMLDLSSRRFLQAVSIIDLFDFQFIRGFFLLKDAMRLVVKSHQIYLGVFSIDRNYRGLGLGKRFLCRVINELKREIVLDVLKSNIRAIEFYRSNGFSIMTNTHKDYPADINLRMKRAFKD